MKIYFCGSISGGRQDADLYSRLIQQLSAFGTVLSAPGEEGNTPRDIHERDIAWLTECDVVVAEVTQPSHGVGYEIGRAVTMDKKILCLFRPASGKRKSVMISGAQDLKNVFVKDYKEEDASQIFKEFFNSC